MIKKTIKYLVKKLGYNIKRINEEVNIVEKNDFEKKLMQKVKNFTLTNDERIWLIIQAVKVLNQNNINGDIVECGVWKGGNLILFGDLCRKYSLDKTIFGYDTYEVMTEPTSHDVNFYEKSAKKNLEKYKNQKKHKNSFWVANDIDDTKKNITNNTDHKKIRLIKGDVLKTLDKKENLPSSISLLRLDTDFYESTKKELEVLYPLLNKGGILIIDDYGHWKGCRKAVDEYFENKNINFFMCDFSCRFMIKDEE